MSGLRPWLLRGWRLLALICAAWLLHVSWSAHNQSRHKTIPLDEARRLFPDAATVRAPHNVDGPDEVFDQNERLLGFIARTSPQADSIIGYAGPNNVLVGLSKSGRVVGLELLSSGDTDAHGKDVRAAESFWKQFLNWSPSHEPAPKIEGVGGSTLTSLGIAEAVQKRLAGRVDSLRFPEAVTLEEIRSLFPKAETFQPETPKPGWHRVNDAGGSILGFAVRTSPFSDFTRGHAGPTECLVGVGPDTNKVTGVRLRRSYDTDDYVQSVREDHGYLEQLTQFDVNTWRTIDLKKSGLEGVSGATSTSFAVAEGIRRRFAGEAIEVAPDSKLFKTRDWALLGIVVGGIVMAFTELRGKRFVRLAWQGILIGVFGLWIGDLLSLALLVGWARNGLAWQTAPALVALAVIALLVPWASRRQVYCHQLCPHGAAQDWLGRFRKLHLHVPAPLEKYLRLLPAVLLAVAFVIGLAMPRFELAAMEPFDAWAMRGAVLAATVIAIIGLVASLFVPMAYCRFGCPTGALLKFVRTTGSSDRFGSRDVAALVLLLLGTAFVFWPASTVTAQPDGKNTVELHGKAFGTTWSVKVRNVGADTNGLQQAVTDELERIESTLSHWRTNSATSQFNRASTTHAVEVPVELVQLVAKALEVSRLSDGAFDITIGPLVSAWGFGPNGTASSAPTTEEIARLRSFTGWQKLLADTNSSTLQKSDPRLQIDLGAILQGYAADQVGQILQANGCDEYLIDVGGELLAKGEWRVAIEDPAGKGKPLRVVLLNDGALATSGSYRASQSDGKKRWSHFIDPTTGEPTQHETTLVSVMHTSCAMADAWATALLVMGKERAQTVAATGKLSILTVTKGRIADFDFPQNRE